jgi:phosphatidylinositol alpha-1,6-mannosyltransferase
LAKILGAKYVVNIYGKEVWSDLRRDARWGLSGADEVISDCHFTASYAEEHGLRSRGSVRVVWDCVDLEKFRPGPPCPEVLARYGIPDPRAGVNVLTLGRMSGDAAHKGYDRLLEVFRRTADRVPNMRLVFAGRGELVSDLRQQAKLAGLSDRVHFTGMVHERDLADVYRSAHVFSLVSDRGPGRGEGIPLTPLEAAACGVPILVGNQDGSQEAVIGEKNGFVLDPFDLDARAAALARLALDERLQRTKGAAALDIAQQVFSYEAFREKHREIAATWGKSLVGTS